MANVTNADVITPTRILRKAFTAMHTFVWFFASVSADGIAQGETLSECSVTKMARIWSSHIGDDVRVIQDNLSERIALDIYCMYIIFLRFSNRRIQVLFKYTRIFIQHFVWCMFIATHTALF
ncbi:hypothetical protein CEXT_441831 [Caerostris extrusa]|uniref:Uncharacterized protein n=1 Tax=Caerostris extrusa TaxID=172846 RepID=A0AAV4VJU7_CAEEX|nr:hypothetical protein CEXT_441831 [Caerostris extrusa]